MSGMVSPLPTISYQTLPPVTLTYPCFTGHPNGNFELSADAALVEADKGKRISITDIAPVIEEKRLPSMDDFLHCFEPRAELQTGFRFRTAALTRTQPNTVYKCRLRIEKPLRLG